MPPVLGHGVARAAGALVVAGAGTVLVWRGGACSTIAGLVTGYPTVVVRAPGPCDRSLRGRRVTLGRGRQG